MSNKLTHSGNIIIAGFGMMILFMCFLVYKSMHNETQMVSDNYYESELKFQDNINASKNAEALGAALSMKQEGNTLHIVVPNEVNAGMSDAIVNMYCISNKSDDRKIILTKNSSGQYTLDASNWKKLSYTAKFSFTSQGKAYYKEIPMIVK